MGFLGKLMFWKKKDEFEDIGLGEKGNIPNVDLGLGPDLGAGADLGQGLSMVPPGTQPSIPSMQQPTQQPLQPTQQPPSLGPNYNQPQMQSQDYATSKNLEVISSKLDALRAALDSINQRLANLETIARGEEHQSYRKRW